MIQDCFTEKFDLPITHTRTCFARAIARNLKNILNAFNKYLPLRMHVIVLALILCVLHHPILPLHMRVIALALILCVLHHPKWFSINS